MGRRLSHKPGQMSVGGCRYTVVTLYRRHEHGIATKIWERTTIFIIPATLKVLIKGMRIWMRFGKVWCIHQDKLKVLSSTLGSDALGFQKEGLIRSIL